MVIKRILSTVNLDFVIALEKRVALFVIAAQLKISRTFYFLRDLDIGKHYLPSRI